jgi:hypothetical protein
MRSVCIMNLIALQFLVRIEKPCLDSTLALIRPPTPMFSIATEWCRIKGGVESRKVSNQGRCRIKGGVESREVTNQGKCRIKRGAESGGGGRINRVVESREV